MMPRITVVSFNAMDMLFTNDMSFSRQYIFEHFSFIGIKYASAVKNMGQHIEIRLAQGVYSDAHGFFGRCFLIYSGITFNKV
jgi:hypothetical protein